MFRRLYDSAILPQQATAGSAAYDLHAFESSYIGGHHSRATIATGIAVDLPPGHVGLICSRSGLAHKHGIFVLNAPGIIDPDYTGELKVILGRLPMDPVWPGLEPNFHIMRGDRIAQLLILPFATFAANASSLVRGDAGLGSTGVQPLAN
jgi:dUTP pyrophosphatase